MARIFRRAITVHKLLISLSIGQTIAILKFYFLEAVENKENPLGPSSFTYIYNIYFNFIYIYEIERQGGIRTCQLSEEVIKKE